MLRAVLIFLLVMATCLRAGNPVYVVLWFDTEDYIEPASDDAALRIATDLTALGVRATFKVVGEKARVLEKRGRRDVISALLKHDIGYHSNWHSVHPAPSEYLVTLGFLEGADEFERRESAGVAMIKQVFGRGPSCYGQPGDSWGPQSYPALRRLGIPVYLDEADQVGVDHQPFWFGGLLHVFNMGPNLMRADLKNGTEDVAADKMFDEAAARLSRVGGGVISVYYHPNEFVTTQFWDAANFSHGANPPRNAWVRPQRRTPEDSERCYGILQHFVRHVKANPDVQFVTASDLPRIYKGQLAQVTDRKAAAEAVLSGVTFHEVQGNVLSPADMLLALLGVDSQIVDGPTTAGVSSYKEAAIPREQFERMVADVADQVRRYHRLPAGAFVGAQTLSLEDFAATLAGSLLNSEGEVTVRRGKVEFEKYFATNGRKSFNWVIHPEGFDGTKLLEMARLQGWTLKPAVLAK